MKKQKYIKLLATASDVAKPHYAYSRAELHIFLLSQPSFPASSRAHAPSLLPFLQYHHPRPSTFSATYLVPSLKYLHGEGEWVIIDVGSESRISGSDHELGSTKGQGRCLEWFEVEEGEHEFWEVRQSSSSTDPRTSSGSKTEQCVGWIVWDRDHSCLAAIEGWVRFAIRMRTMMKRISGSEDTGYRPFQASAAESRLQNMNNCRRETLVRYYFC